MTFRATLVEVDDDRGSGSDTSDGRSSRSCLISISQLAIVSVESMAFTFGGQGFHILKGNTTT